MRIGPLRHRVAIQNSTPSQDGYGDDSNRTFSTVETVWGSVEPISGRELLNAQQIQAETTHRIRIRHTTNATSQSRILFKGRTFEIVSLINWMEKNCRLELLCKEIA